MNNKKIPMVNLKAQYRYLKKDIFRRWKKLCDSTQFILGEEVAAFEEEFASFLGARHAIGVSSGTSALHLALIAVGASGRNVITTPFTFVATSEAVIHSGGRVKWADIEEDYYTIDPGSLYDVKPSEAEVIVPVHLYGQPADMSAVMAVAGENNLKVVEDCAQSHGAEFNGKKAGTIGDIGCFSFYPGKNLGAYGDAGCVVCDDKETADLIRRLRTHGSMDKYYHTEIGYNYRLDALQAAVLRIKLRYMDEWNEARRERAALYDKALADVPVRTPEVRSGSVHVYHQYSILVPQRDKLKEYLARNGIASAVHYPIPTHLQPSFSFLDYNEGSFPVAERTARQCLSLPMCPELKLSDIGYICGKIREFYDRKD